MINFSGETNPSLINLQGS